MVVYPTSLVANLSSLYLSDSALWLYLTRTLSGIGAGGISLLVAIIVSELVSLKERGKYQGMVSIAIGMGALAGPFVAGSLVQKSENSWRWVFWVPSILAFVYVMVLVFLLPLKPVNGSWREKATKVDWYGVLASFTGIVLLLVTFPHPMSSFCLGFIAEYQLDRFQLTLEYMAMAWCFGY
ncbi:Major facilitator superfamily domain general substrate transporter [Penicillium malachiteum]|uniref:Major facilitator superfamily domain general substrate transporter n=1 Tax=Penicillium malachiteum TaxID=1324776 RepID=UPI0025495224|nr:Major facilitator superfamily domain general substrate transporter [Penicillium malachiteum]KAJ5712889.1 Major facilitator superfamily domain general substrate transporter [Penicillium malachiteum]